MAMEWRFVYGASCPALFFNSGEGRKYLTAADILHVTQPTLSRQLTQLEEEPGTQLFIRGRHLALTDAGIPQCMFLTELADCRLIRYASRA